MNRRTSRKGRRPPAPRRQTHQVRLQQLRARIDRIDRQLVRLLSQRARLALQTGTVKRLEGRPIVDRRREQWVLRHAIQNNPGPFSRTALRTIYLEILRASRALGLAATR